MMRHDPYYFIAHRGESFLAPENTLAAVNLAWKLGSSFVEVDVHLSADHQVMVCHDDRVSKSAGDKPVISQTHSEVLRRLDVGSWKSPVYQNEKVPFLEEIIATLPDDQGELIVEIKCGPEILPVLQQIMAGSPKKDRLIFIGFGWDTILATKKGFQIIFATGSVTTKQGYQINSRCVRITGSTALTCTIKSLTLN